MPKGTKKATYQAAPTNGNITDVLKQLWQAAVNLRGSIEPADYKRYVLPIIFLRFLSLRYEKRRKDLERMISEPQSLQVKLLERLLADEIEYRERINITRARSFKLTLEQTLLNYHNRLIDAKEVIEQIIAMKQEMDAESHRADTLNLSGEEMAFYDAVATNFLTIYDQALLRDLVHDVVA